MPVELNSPEFWDRLKSDPARLAAEVCFVDAVNLDLTLQRHPSMRAWVNAMHETAKIAEERAKWELTRARAVAYMTAKSTPEPGGKAKAVETLKAEAELDESVRAATEGLFAAQEKRGAFRAIADALEDRLQMLIQISAKARQEAKEYAR